MNNIIILILFAITMIAYAILTCYFIVNINRSMDKISQKERDTIKSILDILYQEWRCKYGSRK